VCNNNGNNGKKGKKSKKSKKAKKGKKKNADDNYRSNEPTAVQMAAVHEAIRRATKAKALQPPADDNNNNGDGDGDSVSVSVSEIDGDVTDTAVIAPGGGAVVAGGARPVNGNRNNGSANQSAIAVNGGGVLDTNIMDTQSSMAGPLAALKAAAATAATAPNDSYFHSHNYGGGGHNDVDASFEHMADAVATESFTIPIMGGNNNSGHGSSSAPASPVIVRTSSLRSSGGGSAIVSPATPITITPIGAVNGSHELVVCRRTSKGELVEVTNIQQLHDSRRSIISSAQYSSMRGNMSDPSSPNGIIIDMAPPPYSVTSSYNLNNATADAISSSDIAATMEVSHYMPASHSVDTIRANAIVGGGRPSADVSGTMIANYGAPVSHTVYAGHAVATTAAEVLPRTSATPMVTSSYTMAAMNNTRADAISPMDVAATMAVSHYGPAGHAAGTIRANALPTSVGVIGGTASNSNNSNNSSRGAGHLRINTSSSVAYIPSSSDVSGTIVANYGDHMSHAASIYAGHISPHHAPPVVAAAVPIAAATAATAGVLPRTIPEYLNDVDVDGDATIADVSCTPLPRDDHDDDDDDDDGALF
jgi:hypothetical protein